MNPWIGFRGYTVTLVQYQSLLHASQLRHDVDPATLFLVSCDLQPACNMGCDRHLSIQSYRERIGSPFAQPLISCWSPWAVKLVPLNPFTKFNAGELEIQAHVFVVTSLGSYHAAKWPAVTPMAQVPLLSEAFSYPEPWCVIDGCMVWTLTNERIECDPSAIIHEQNFRVERDKCQNRNKSRQMPVVMVRNKKKTASWGTPIKPFLASPSGTRRIKFV